MMKRTMCGFCVVFQSVSSPVAGRELRHGAARLHRRRNQPLLDDPIAHDDFGADANAASTSPPATVQ